VNATLTGALARLCRTRRGKRLTGRIDRFVAPRIPQTGTSVADFGRRRKIRCDLAIEYDRSVYLGREEFVELQLIARLLARGDTFVDCGANIGLFTVFGADLVGPNGCVIAVEPVAPTFTRLQENVELSRVTDRVRLLHHALAAESDEVVGLAGDEHNGMRVTDGTGSIDFQSTTITLDRVLEDVPDVAGLKIDVEGYEIQVLRGAETTIRRHSPWILIEFNSQIAGTDDLRGWDVHGLLTAHGYVAHLPRSLAGGDAAPISTAWRNPRAYTNLLYWPVTRDAIGRAMPSR